MDTLNHPNAQALLADAELSAETVRSCADRLTAFAQRYLPRFHREEQRPHALTILRGKLTGLPRKTTEPTCARKPKCPACGGPTRRSIEALWQIRSMGPTRAGFGEIAAGCEGAWQSALPLLTCN